MATSLGILGFGGTIRDTSLVLLLAGSELFRCGGVDSKAAITCPGGRPPVRAAAVHTQSDYALACTDGHGVWQGPYQEYFAKGTLAVSGYYKGGEPDGTWTFFYPQGTRMMRGAFRAGRRNGLWSSYYENGRILGQGPYRADALDGHWTAWYENGARKSDGNYRKGEEIGRWTYWYPNGRRDRKGEYRGRRIVPPRNASVPAEWGKWTYWYETGGKRQEGCFRNGEQIGVWTDWSPEGQVTSRVTHGRNINAAVACR